MAEMTTPKVLAAVLQSSDVEDTAGADAKMEREIDREICNAGFVPDHFGEE